MVLSPVQTSGLGLILSVFLLGRESARVEAAESRLIKGRKYLDTSRPEWQDMAPIFKLVKEVMAAREKK